MGLVVKTGLNSPFPAEFKKLTLDQAYEIKEHLNKILGTWSIVAFENGKIDGTGYGNKIHETYGNECG